MSERKTLLEIIIVENEKPTAYPPPDNVAQMLEALAIEAEKRIAALEAHLPTPTQQETIDTPTTEQKAWNHVEDDFYSWCGKQNNVVLVNGRTETAKRNHLIRIGNCFQTREEAEHEGKWRYETKLVLDQRLRASGINPQNVCWSFVRPSLHTLRGEYYTKDFSDKVYAILGTHAKRYLTGVR